MPGDSDYNNRPIDSGVQDCPPCHWFSIELVHADKGRPRPSWWPREQLKGYGGEPFAITLAGVGPRQKLDGSGRFRADHLPGGSGSVTFDSFYKDIEAQLKSGRVF